MVSSDVASPSVVASVAPAESAVDRDGDAPPVVPALAHPVALNYPVTGSHVAVPSDVASQPVPRSDDFLPLSQGLVEALRLAPETSWETDVMEAMQLRFVLKDLTQPASVSSSADEVLADPQEGFDAVDHLVRMLTDLYGTRSFTGAELIRDLKARNVDITDCDELIDVLIDDGWAATEDMENVWLI